MRRLLIATLLLAPLSASAERQRHDLTLDIVPLGLGQKYQPPPKLVYKLFPGVDPTEARGPGRAPYLPIIRIGLDEGPFLETVMWGGTGAMVGTLFGPGGTVIGGAVGSACGFVYGCVLAMKAPLPASPRKRGEGL